MSEDLYARLVPASDRLGYHVRGHMYKGITFLGGERPTWYQVTREFAQELAQFKQDQHDPYAKPLFQIYDADSKALVEKIENEKYLAMLGAVTATVSIPRELQAPATMAVRGGEASLVSAPPTQFAPQGPSVMPMSMADIARDPGGRAAALPPTRAPAREATPVAAFVPPMPATFVPPPSGDVIMAAVVRPRGSNDEQDG